MKQTNTTSGIPSTASETVSFTAYIPFTLSEGNSIEETNGKYLSEYRYEKEKTLLVFTPSFQQDYRIRKEYCDSRTK
jgi:hypothetical protein